MEYEKPSASTTTTTKKPGAIPHFVFHSIKEFVKPKDKPDKIKS